MLVDNGSGDPAVKQLWGLPRWAYMNPAFLLRKNIVA